MAKKAAQEPKRQKKQASYKHFKLAKKIKSSHEPLPGVFSLLSSSLKTMRHNKALFGGIILIHSFLSLVFVAGLGSSLDFVEAKKQVDEFLGGQITGVAMSTTLLAYLFDSTSAQAGEVAGTYQLFLILITSLAVIWAVRETMAGQKVTAKMSYYKGLYPLVPLVLVMVVIGLQLIPVILGSTIYSIIVAGGLAVNSIEKILWLVFFVLTALLSLYMVLSSLFAIYIVTLPDMTPMKALRSARGLVLHRRWSIGIRVVALPLLMGVTTAIVLLPIVFLAPVLAVVASLLLGAFFICLWNLYIYSLYRKML